MEPETFIKLWDWSCFLDFMKLLSNVDQHHAGLLLIPDIRWCGIQIISILLKLGYEAATNLSSGSEESLACLLRYALNLGGFCNITKITSINFMLPFHLQMGRILSGCMLGESWLLS